MFSGFGGVKVSAGNGAAGLLLRGAGWRGVLGVTERLVYSRAFEMA